MAGSYAEDHRDFDMTAVFNETLVEARPGLSVTVVGNCRRLRLTLLGDRLYE